MKKLTLTLLFLSLSFITIPTAKSATLPFPNNKTSISYIPLSSHTTLQLQTESKVKEKNLLVKDYLASTRVISNETGGVVTENSFYPYGQIKSATTGNQPTDKQFTGHRKMEGSNVYHAGARFYSPVLGTFLQPDPVEGLNRFIYAGNNPISYNDPTGNTMERGASLKQNNLIEGSGCSGEGCRCRSNYCSSSYPTIYGDDPTARAVVTAHVASTPIVTGLGYAGASVLMGVPQLGIRAGSACMINPLLCMSIASTAGEVALGEAMPPGYSLVQVPGPGLSGYLKRFWLDDFGSLPGKMTDKEYFFATIQTVLEHPSTKPAYFSATENGAVIKGSHRILMEPSIQKEGHAILGRGKKLDMPKTKKFVHALWNVATLGSREAGTRKWTDIAGRWRTNVTNGQGLLRFQWEFYKHKSGETFIRIMEIYDK